MEDYAEEDIRIDPAMMNAAFKSGLKRGKLLYLEELEHMATSDYELEGETVNISVCFSTVKKFFSTRERLFGEFELSDLIRFGLTSDIVGRIGYLAFQYDSISPKQGARKGFLARDAKHEDYDYDDDFEDIEDEENEPRLEGSDELYVDRQGADVGGGAGARDRERERERADRERGDKHADSFDQYDAHFDIEDETYDNSRVKLPRASPEIMYQNRRARAILAAAAT
ncbi:hypothetical protein B484DRAFT_193955 [Ochromonadaceae sp. CCMP2298]|nr:hypothetical protein B484DRAFT_193955 [Ochromonadaceae sp. CCMP2298]